MITEEELASSTDSSEGLEDEEESVLPKQYNVAGMLQDSSLQEDIFVDRSRLNDEFAEHASRFGWYSTAYELCVDHEARLKAKLERAYAQLDAQARAQMEAAGVKVTEKKVENTVITQPEYISIYEEYLDAKLQVGLLKAARDAMIHKKEMLVSLGANLRSEMKSDPSLLAEAYKDKYGK